MNSEPAFKDHFSSASAGYARYRPRYPVDLVRHPANTAPRRELAWDCGCGSGQMAALLADHFESVLATDASAEQIARAAPHPRVSYRRARAEESGIWAESVDLVVAAQAVHWFDLDLFYRESRRAARAGALLALVGYGRLNLASPAKAVVDHFYTTVLGRYWPPERQLVEDGYRTLPFPFEELRAPGMAMQASWNREELLGYVDTWSSVRALVASGHGDRLDDFRRELARVWPDADARQTITWPLSVRVGKL